MPILNTDAPDCYMVSYQRGLDADGNIIFTELTDPDASDQSSGLMSDSLVALMAQRQQQGLAFTDIFFLNHGFWKTEAAAVTDFTNWINAVQKARTTLGGPPTMFLPLIVATHWPSDPSADDSTVQIPAAPANASGSAAVNAALAKLSAASGSTWSRPLGADLLDAINDAMADAERLAGAPAGTLTRLPAGAMLGDAIAWIWLVISTWSAANDLFTGLYDLIVRPLFDLLLRAVFVDYGEFAGLFGRTGVRGLIAKLTANGVRWHIMGHSLGAGVTGGALTPPAGTSSALTQPYSVFFAQGAISTWSFANQVPMAGNKPGMYAASLPFGGFSGPILATQSLCDFMVRYPYPGAAQWAGWSGTGETVTSGTAADYQGIGVAGIAGPLTAGQQPQPLQVKGQAIAKFGTYNVDATGFINGHSDIYNDAIAELYWNAVLASLQV
jgi:hypothetical protein